MKVFLLLLGFILFTVAQNSKNLIEDLNNIEICATLNNVNRTFSNIWEIYEEFKRTGDVWTPVARGACVANNLDCMILNPVCAITNNFFQKTFPNKCVLEADQKSSGIQWHVIYNGICRGDGFITPTTAPSLPVPQQPHKQTPAPSVPYSPSLSQNAPAALSTNKYISRPLANPEPLPLKIPAPTTNVYSPPIATPPAVPVPPANNYQQSNTPQQPSNSVPPQEPSQSSAISQLYEALVNYYESLPKQESLYSGKNDNKFLPVPVAAPAVTSPPSYLKINPNYGNGVLAVQPNEASSKGYKQPEAPSYSDLIEIPSNNYENDFQPPPAEQSYAAPVNQPAYEISSNTYGANGGSAYIASDNSGNKVNTPAKNYETAPYSGPVESPFPLNPSNSYEVPYAAPDTANPYKNGGSNEVITTSVKNYEAQSYAVPSENTNSIPAKNYASIDSVAGEIPTPTSCTNLGKNYETPSKPIAVENPLPSYTNPINSYEAPSYPTPVENPPSSYPSSAINYKSIPNENPSYSYSSSDDNFEVPSYAANVETPSSSYQSYAATAEEPSPSAPSYEEIQSLPAEAPCSKADSTYASPVLDYNSLPSYSQKTYEAPLISDSDYNSKYENSDASQPEAPISDNAESAYNIPAEESEQNLQGDGQTVYNGVVYQGPYHYEPKYKHINYGNFNFLPAQSPKSDEVAPAAPALVPAYTYANALPASQYNAFSSNPFEQLLQYMASKNK